MSNTPRSRFTLRMLACVVMLVPAFESTAQPASPTQTISEEGERQQAIHNYLFDVFAEGRKTVYQGNGPGRGLKELTILDQTKVDSRG